MTANRAANVFQRIRAEHAEPDGDLLGRFAQARDAAAFAVLVQRHGPLVLGVCRRTLGHAHDAEDAFQAVFLVLAQKAGTLRDVRALSSWLYGVAWRVAKKARRRAARRREEWRPDVPEPLTTDVPMNDLGPALDEELATLPAWYRDAVLACDVDGLSRAEAAAKLGIPEGTLSSRLAKGRKRLAERLARRGVTLALPALATLATASVSEALIQQAVETAAQWAAGGAVAKPVAELTHEGLTMVRKLLLLGTGILAAGVVGAGVASDPAKPDAKPPAKAVPKAAAAEVAKSEAKVSPPRARAIVKVHGQFDAVHWSADGLRVAVSGAIRGSTQQFGTTRSIYAEYKLIDDGLQTLAQCKADGIDGDVLGIPTDEGSILLHVAETGGINVRNSFVLTDTKAKKPVDLVDDSLTFLAMTADGRAVLMQNYDEAEKQTSVVEVDFTTGKVRRAVFRTPDEVVAVSPDGGAVVTVTREKRKVKVVGPTGDVERDEQFVNELTAWDGKTGQKRFAWKLPKGDHYSVGVALARDGRSLSVPLAEACYVFDAVSGREIKRYPAGQNRYFTDAILSHDGRLTVTQEYTTVRDAAAGGPGAPPPAPSRSPTFVTVYDNATGKAIKKWETNLALMMAFAPDRPALAILECPVPERASGPGGMGGPGMGGMPGGMGAAPAATGTGRLGIWEFPVEKK